MDGNLERLVAILAYKALFPKDFELLQVGRGYLHEVLCGKQWLITSFKNFIPKGATGRLLRLDSAENASFETQPTFSVQAASYNRR